MGNCQAAEAATVVIVHPGTKIERIYWSVSANEIMTSNPGHYVALVITSPSAKTEDGRSVKQLKLLRPDDTLHIGSVYRLISFEDVLKEFAAKKCVKLGRLLRDRGAHGLGLEKKNSKPSSKSVEQKQQQQQELNRPGSSNSRVARHQHYQSGQWKPALQSIAEVGN